MQEALTNVARHSGAHQVTLQVVADERVTVLIEDHGAGFEIEKVAAMHSSTGLSAMRERVDLLGGHLDIESRPGVGTKLMAEIPLEEGPGARG